MSVHHNDSRNSVSLSPSSAATIGNFAMNELSMSIHHASVISKESWPVRLSHQEQDNWIVTQTRRTVDTLRRDSTFFEQNSPKGLPTFQPTELDCGKVIGNGEFGMVFEVNGFKLQAGQFGGRESARNDGG
jgi:hypothetical protein